jgi:hypothetical protein
MATNDRSAARSAENQAYLLRARVPGMSRAAINSQRRPPAATQAALTAWARAELERRGLAPQPAEPRQPQPEASQRRRPHEPSKRRPLMGEYRRGRAVVNCELTFGLNRLPLVTGSLWAQAWAASCGHGLFPPGGDEISRPVGRRL